MYLFNLIIINLTYSSELPNKSFNQHICLKHLVNYVELGVKDCFLKNSDGSKG